MKNVVETVALLLKEVKGKGLDRVLKYRCDIDEEVIEGMVERTYNITITVFDKHLLKKEREKK